MSRRVRLAVLGLLTPIALVVWQQAVTVRIESAVDDTQSIRGPWVQSKDLAEHRSPILADFYRSPAWDSYVETWVASQEDASAWTSDCERARDRAFLPPYAGRVDAACADLLGAGERTRLAAFIPVMTKFLRACRGAPTGTPAPYSSEQWAELDAILDHATREDCIAPEAEETAPV